MKTIENRPGSFNQHDSLQVIREMIEVSQKKLKSDGILFIAWGWIAFTNYFFLNYLVGVSPLLKTLCNW